jgi:uncharacterized protein YacL
MSRRLAARMAAFLGVTAIAAVVGFSINNNSKAPWPWEVLVGIAIICGVIAFIILPYVTTIPYRWVRDQIRKAEVSDLVAGSIGLVSGLIIAALLAIPLSQLSFFQLGRWLPTIVAVFCAYLGITIAVLRKEDFTRLTSSAFAGRAARRANREEREGEGDDHDEHEEREEKTRLRERFGARNKARNSDKILVDTSAIIDGRIADISQTGFITSTLVVPRFVLEELQHIADSADGLKRNRGRRGLEILQRLKDSHVPIEISDADAENTPEVDAKLVKLARQWHCSIITNDFNLNRVAELQGVKVLNINELAHAVKPILLPGEEMQVAIMQDGKENGQGVGYLDDGTMIVVEGGKSYMGSTIEVTVTRVLQTVAGRMIFAHPKQPASNVAPVRRTGTA